MISIAFYFLLLLVALVSGLFFNLAYRLWRADSLESEKSAARAGGFFNALLGRTRVHDDWAPDARVKGGLIFNRRMKRFEISGRLSSDSLNRVFH